MNKISVFISSTCFDRSDSYSISEIRKKLGERLKECGFEVRLSDDALSSFSVNPRVDSITNCLQNVESSDVVVVIITNQYGPLLHNGYGDISATHLEVRHAREKRKRVLFFIDRKTYEDFIKCKQKGEGETYYFEKNDHIRRQRMVVFLKEVKSLSEAVQDGYSNWIDMFDAHEVDKLIEGVCKRVKESCSRDIRLVP